MKWSAADEVLLRERFPHVKTELLVETMGRNYRSIANKAHKLKLRKTDAFFASEAPGHGNLERGASTRFAKNNVPHNKGKPFNPGGKCATTQFKAGQRAGRAAQLVMPVGSYRINGDGYLDRKFSEQPGAGNKRWRAAHLLIWEAANGPLPKGSIVVFKPGKQTTNPDDLLLENVELITRQELMRRNTIYRFTPEIVSLCKLRGVLNRKINAQTK